MPVFIKLLQRWCEMLFFFFFIPILLHLNHNTRSYMNSASGPRVGFLYRAQRMQHRSSLLTMWAEAIYSSQYHCKWDLLADLPTKPRQRGKGPCYALLCIVMTSQMLLGIYFDLLAFCWKVHASLSRTTAVFYIWEHHVTMVILFSLIYPKVDYCIHLTVFLAMHFK